MLCSPSKRTWGDSSFFKNQSAACSKFAEAGVKSLAFAGDSFMRHIFQGFSITLSGDYKRGAVGKFAPEICEFHNQFSEKYCSMNTVSPKILCDGSVEMELGWADPQSYCKSDSKTVVFFSYGNHQINGVHNRHTINNAQDYISLFEEQNICDRVQTKPANCEIYWVSTHHRLRNGSQYPGVEETYERIEKYNIAMRNYFTSPRCNGIKYIDVYNLTKSLMDELPAWEAELMAYDHAHWGMEVNLLKVQIILNALFHARA